MGDASGSADWRKEVCERFSALKAAPFSALRLPSVQGTGVTLAPFTADKVADDALIALLTRWRTENIGGFTKLFRPTFDGTRAWSRSQLIERPDRILFLVVDSDSRPVGHLGLSSFDFEAGTCEIDNVVRGEATAPAGVMTDALATLLDWTYRGLGPAQIRLRTLADNARALALYHRLDFVPLSLIALEKVVSGETTEWIETGKSGHIDRFFVLMAHRSEAGAAGTARP
ncbi:GNAT family N-acetyltransferase [Bradyrhizobium sp. HKCCYLS1011]|uniref:GNAT family N-acetyltransferase n=1 Tax=Bradyrhizobium sp. HKCCYLS1011 TaxID=3420733 RepID=UPI003EB75D73